MSFTYATVFATGVPLTAANLNKCLLGYGPYADFPAAAPYVSPASPGNAGMLAFATDQNKLYASNGTTWVFVAYGIISLSAPSSPTRAIGSTYHNTTGHVLVVDVTATVTSGGGHYLSLNVSIGASSPPGTSIAATQHTADTGSPIDHLHFLVPIGYYYKITDYGSPAPTLQTWSEMELG